MSRRKYPHLDTTGTIEPKKRGGRKCEACGEQATRRLYIQYSWFRGEDGVMDVCETHCLDARANLAAIVNMAFSRNAASAAFRYMAKGVFA